MAANSFRYERPATSTSHGKCLGQQDSEEQDSCGFPSPRRSNLRNLQHWLDEQARNRIDGVAEIAYRWALLARRTLKRSTGIARKVGNEDCFCVESCRFVTKDADRGANEVDGEA